MTPRHRDERGFTSVWVLGLTMMILVMGIAVFDAWNVYATQRKLTAQADAAAAAGAQGVDVGEFESTNGMVLVLAADDVTTLASKRLSADLGAGKVDTGNAATPTADKAAATIIVADDSKSVTVTLSRKVNFTIFAILGKDSQTVTASATAAPQLR